MAVVTWLLPLVITGGVFSGDVAQPASLSEPQELAARQDDSSEAERNAPEIVVIGRRSAILADVSPEIELGPQDVSSFGASTIGELLGYLSPQTTGAGSPSSLPLVLINGQRTLGLDEISSLPPEAVMRIEILPEHVALRYGMRPGKKVVNLVLKPRFRAITAEGSFGAATDGGRSLGQTRVNVAGITPGGRWSLNAAYLAEGSLSEKERSVSGSMDPLRTLLPRTERLSLGGSFARNLSSTSDISVTAKIEQRSVESRIGRFVEETEANSNSIQTLRRNSLNRSAKFGADVNGVLGSWSWSATGNYERVHQQIGTQLPAAPRRVLLDSVRSVTQAADLELLAFGDLASLPSGPLMVTFGAQLEAFAFENRSSTAAAPVLDKLNRQIVRTRINFEAPLLDGSMAGLEGFGELWANFNFDLEYASSFGALKTIGTGLRWTPAPWFSLSVSASEKESAPDTQSVSEPVISVPNVRTFDFTTGKTVDVLRIEGGNPDLLAEKLSSFDVNLSLRPLPRRNFVVTASYTRRRVSDPVRTFSIATPQVEAVFPERFERSPEGQLVRIDARPLNFARTDRTEFRWGFSLFKRLSEVPKPQTRGNAPGAVPVGADAASEAGFDLREMRQPPNPGFLQLALYHTWILRDQLVIRQGTQPLDFLKGSPSGLGGGTPGHRVELQAAFYKAGIGARLTGSWKSATTVRSEDRKLFYDSIAGLDLRLFADLGEQRGFIERMPWLGRTRIALEVDNLTNARPKVRDLGANTPFGLQSAYLDPAGRTVRISLRKLF